MSESDEAFADGLLDAVTTPVQGVDIAQGFELWYRSVLPKVYAFVRSQVSDTHTAQDLVSHIFLKAYHHRDRLPAGQAAVLWIFRVAQNALIDHWRVEGRRAAATLSIDELVDVPENAVSPEASYARRQRQRVILRAMSSLNETDRLVLSMKFAGQRTNREIAKILHMSEGAISMRLLRALQRMRARLREVDVQ